MFRYYRFLYKRKTVRWSCIPHHFLIHFVATVMIIAMYNKCHLKVLFFHWATVLSGVCLKLFRCHNWLKPCVHFVNAIPISLICLFSSVKNYIALSLSLSYTSRVMAFKGLSKFFFFHWAIAIASLYSVIFYCQVNWKY